MFSSSKCLLGFIFLACFVSSLKASGLGPCDKVIRRLFGEEVANRFSETRNRDNLLRSQKKEVMGSDTKILYEADFRLHLIPQAEGFYVQYSFLPTNTMGLNRVPSIYFIASNDRDRAHLLKVDLNRDLGDELQDLNLLTEVMGSLFKSSERNEDQFQISISDTRLIEEMNALLHENLTKSGDWQGRAPILIRSKPNKIPDTKVLCFQDSVIKGVCREDFIWKMEIADSDDILKALTTRLRSSEFYASLLKSGNWDIGLSLESFDVEIDEEDGPISGMIFKYIIHLRPAW